MRRDGPATTAGHAPSMTSVRLPGFSPATSGFHFTNFWPKGPLKVISIPGVASLDIGDVSNGLCGGMSFTVADLFLASKAPPPDTNPFGPGAPYDYIRQRQIDSFAGIALPVRFLELMDPSRPAREPFWARWIPPMRIGSIVIDRNSRTWVMVHDEWPGIQADLDAGRPAMLGLVRVVDTNANLLGHNHQVLAYGYDLEGTALTLRIYDPNYPNTEVTLSIDVGDPNGTAAPTYSTNDPATICFFHAPYGRSDPTAAFPA